ncbi:MAG: AI-2E family transporter [Candidatus Levybacteria bacterium]|nr:AI-2E family transporter [Candidatus Levybacteria bacterium]
MRNPIVNYIINNHFLATVIILSFVWLAIQLSGILIIIFISYIIMAALSPFSDYLTQKRIPRIIAIIIPYVVTIAVLVLLIFPLIPFFTSQIQQFIKTLPEYVDRTTRLLNVRIDANNINQIITSDFEAIGKNALNVTGKIFSGVFSFFAMFVISFYLMLGRERLRKEASMLIPEKYRKKGLETITQIEKKLGAWFRGQIVLSFVVGFAVWIALTVLSLPFALPLALLAGILEIVPTIGPIIAAIPAVLIAFTISPTIAISVIVVYIIIQMLENNILVPKIMEKAVGLSPIIVIIGVLVGSQFLGILGALLAVPFIAMCIIIFKSFKSSNS